MDYSFTGVNANSVPLAPWHAMQFGTTLQRILQRLCYCNPAFGPPLMAKIDLSNGYYRVPLSPEVALELAVVLPPDHTGDNLIGIPLSLPMGWVQSPPYFCAFTETITDIANTQPTQSLDLHPLLSMTHGPPSAVHGYHPQALLPDQITPPLAPLTYVDVYLDDFMAVAQRPQHTSLMNHLLHSIDTIFLDSPHTPQRQLISQSKLDKGDATWSTTKRILGWDVDSSTMTLRLPTHQLERLHNLLMDILPKTRVSRTKWYQILGELRSMAAALKGARYLFSILQHALVDQKGPRIRVKALLRQSLHDWLQLGSSVEEHPVPIATLVPQPPSILAATDASKQGMGGFYVPTSIGPHITPTVWRSPFADDITTHLVSSNTAQGTLTNSNLELAAIITGAATIAQSASSPH